MKLIRNKSNQKKLKRKIRNKFNVIYNISIKTNLYFLLIIDIIAKVK